MFRLARSDPVWWGGVGYGGYGSILFGLLCSGVFWQGGHGAFRLGLVRFGWASYGGFGRVGSVFVWRDAVGLGTVW